jgi:predicted RNA-binding protein with EMAP domain
MTTTFNKVDVVFVIDTTGSMSPFISMARTNIKRIIDDASSKLDIMCGVVEFRDHPPEDTSFVTKVHKFGKSALGNSDKIKSVIQRIAPSGGGDEPEAVYDGVYAAATGIDWRSGTSARIIVLVGDAMPHAIMEHDVEVLAGLKNSGKWSKKTPSGIGLHECTAAAEKVGAIVYAIPLSVGRVAKEFERIADMTGGKLGDINNPIKAINALMSELQTTSEDMEKLHNAIKECGIENIESIAEKLGFKLSYAYSLYGKIQSLE